jgi:hypothetical protein
MLKLSSEIEFGRGHLLLIGFSHEGHDWAVVGYNAGEARRCMMTTLEQEILSRFLQLTPEARERMLFTLQTEVCKTQFTLAEALAKAKASQITLQHDASTQHKSIADWINEVREERLNVLSSHFGLRDSTSDSGT